MNRYIQQLVESCSACLERLPSQPPEPLKLSTATSPMSEVAVDLFEFAGQTWLVMVDRFSGFPFAKRLTSLTTKTVTNVLFSWFLDWGFPDSARTDGGPQFRGQFDDFCKQNAIVHEVTSPYNSQSNGLAEAAVKNVKSLLSKCSQTSEDFQIALSTWRCIPRADGFSPAEMFLGRRPRGILPSIRDASTDKEGSAKVRSRMQRRSKEYLDSRSRPLQELNMGQPVVFKDIGKWTKQGIIIDRRGSRSYVIETSDGQKFVQNRRLIRPKSSGSTQGEEETIVQSSSDADDSPRRSQRLASKKNVKFSI